MDNSIREQIIKILSSHPVFSKLNLNELRTLVTLSVLSEYKSNQIICCEGDIVDAIYLTLSGQQQVLKCFNGETNIVAHLSPGEIIGLDSENFFSATGARTATVIAETDTLVAKLNLEELYQLLKECHLSNLFQNNAELFLRMDFIKKSMPFKKVENEKLKYYADQIKEISFPANTVIFKQGELGEHCYLIKSGNVGITTIIHDIDKQIATLESLALFGESALLLDVPRNATAITLSDTVLLAMHKDLFNELIKSSTQIKEDFFLIQASRIRPKKAEAIEAFESKNEAGETIFTLRNNLTHQYFLLPEQGYYLWRQIDGVNSVHALIINLYQKYDIFAPHLIHKLLNDLAVSGFIQADARKISTDPITAPFWIRFFIKLRKVMEIKFPITNIDQFITNTYQRYVWVLFKKPFLILTMLICVFGFGIFLLYLKPFILHLSLITNKWTILIVASLVVTWTCIPHELAHAYTTKYFGRRVYYFGAGWLWLGPFAFCDTSDMWLNPANDRVLVDLSGPYCNFVIGSLAALTLPFLSNPSIQVFCWFFILFNYLLVFNNLNPILRLDGYYVLMDLTNNHNLRESAVVFMIDLLRQPKNIISLIRSQTAAFYYWLVTFSYLIISALINYYVSFYLLLGLFGISKPFISIMISLVSTFLISVSIWAEILSKRYR